MVPPKL